MPAGVRANGLPFGVSLIGPAFSEQALLCLADRFHRAQTAVPGDVLDLAACPPGCIAVAVVGAHLSGQPLNHELRDRQARLIKTCRTAPGYRLYALDGTMPAKPGLVRDQQFRGPGIEVEVWAMPEHQFGSFVGGVPAPLGIGNAVLDDGSTVKSLHLRTVRGGGRHGNHPLRRLAALPFAGSISKIDRAYKKIRGGRVRR